jgi:ketosteroid isomerase-like protein
MRCDPASVVEGFFAAWEQQDVETSLAYCVEDIVYSVKQPSGVYGLGREICGKPALRSYLNALVAVWEFLDLRGEIVGVEGDTVRVTTHFRCRHRPTGETIDGRKRHVWKIETGRVLSCTEYQDAFALAAFLRMAERKTANGKQGLSKH